MSDEDQVDQAEMDRHEIMLNAFAGGWASGILSFCAQLGIPQEAARFFIDTTLRTMVHDPAFQAVLIEKMEAANNGGPDYNPVIEEVTVYGRNPFNI